MTALENCKCIPSPALLSDSEINNFLTKLENWDINSSQDSIYREFQFNNYYNTIAFVNAIAWIVHREDHHPDIKISYNKCHITYNTHSVSGLSKNDFICAAKINIIIAS